MGDYHNPQQRIKEIDSDEDEFVREEPLVDPISNLFVKDIRSILGQNISIAAIQSAWSKTTQLQNNPHNRFQASLNILFEDHLPSPAKPVLKGILKNLNPPAPKNQIVISSDEEEDADLKVVVKLPRSHQPPEKAKGKGTGKESGKVKPQTVINLSSDDELPVPRLPKAGPAPKGILKRPPRLPSPPRPLLPPVFFPRDEQEQDLNQPIHPHRAPQEPVHDPLPLAPAEALPPQPPAVNPDPDPDLAVILSLIPDVLPSHLQSLLSQVPINDPGRVDSILGALFASDYPKVDKNGRKRDRDEGDGGGGEDERDWLDVGGRKAEGKDYEEAALSQLSTQFPLLPLPQIRQVLVEKKFYSPSYLRLDELVNEVDDKKRGFKLLTLGRNDCRNAGKGKGKGKEKEVVCGSLERELIGWGKQWKKIQQAKSAKKAKDLQTKEDIGNGEFFECGCCFGDSGFGDLVTCALGCTFCVDCVISHTSHLLGQRITVIPCMSTTSCPSEFPASDASSYLPPTTLKLLHKIKQERDLEEAFRGMEGKIFHCPFCPWAAEVEDEEDEDGRAVVRCGREECGKVSCRKCKKGDHGKKSCEEVEADQKIGDIHKVEEAMSAALIRLCPQCKNPYMKEAGCNKIVCPTCRTLSCYICMKVINGYEHFVNAGTNAKFTENGASCPLWDDQNARNFAEVEAARIAAAAVVVKENPLLQEADLKSLDLPPPSPPPARPVVAPPQAPRHPLPVMARHRNRNAHAAAQLNHANLHIHAQQVAQQQAVYAQHAVQQQAAYAQQAAQQQAAYARHSAQQQVLYVQQEALRQQRHAEILAQQQQAEARRKQQQLEQRARRQALEEARNARRERAIGGGGRK